MVSFVLFVVFQYTCNREVSAGVRYLIPEGKVMKEILSVGFPAIIMQAVGSFSMPSTSTTQTRQEATWLTCFR